jgi:hypothetical protein
MKVSNLTDTQYLMYNLKRTKKTIDDYDAFSSDLSLILTADEIEYIDKVYQTQYINIRPYLFTVHTTTSHAFKSFLVYVHHYLKKAEYNIEDINALNVFNKSSIYSYNVQILLNLLKYSNLMMVSVLFLMQYYFL